MSLPQEEKSKGRFGFSLVKHLLSVITDPHEKETLKGSFPEGSQLRFDSTVRNVSVPTWKQRISS